MQATLRAHLPSPLRLRFIRRLRVALVRFLRDRLREPSPVIDRITPEGRDRFGFSVIRRCSVIRGPAPR